MLNKFTIITSALNCQDSIERTLESINEQDYSLLEYIVINGGSKDRTQEYLRRYKDVFAHVISEPDEGIYDAWNKGLKLATGDWICFIGCGDLLKKNALTKYNDYIANNPGLEFISAKMEVIDTDGKFIRTVGSPWKWRLFKKYMNTLHTGCLHHKSLFKKYGIFNKEFKIAGDYEFLLRAKRNLKAGFLDYTVVKMVSGGISVSDITVFDEVEKAKRLHTNRSISIIRIEKYYHIFKFCLKHFLRKYFGIRYI